MMNPRSVEGPVEGSPAGWPARPLCRRYVLGLFDVAPVRTRDARGAHDHALHWAFGWLADGECEPLGVWIASPDAAEAPARLVAGLRAAGVERIWHVAGPAVAPLRVPLAAAFASTVPRADVDRALAQAPVGGWHRTRTPERVAAQARTTLTRALRRQGSFETAAAVLDFATSALQRMERRMDRGGVTTTMRPRPGPAPQRLSPGV